MGNIRERINVQVCGDDISASDLASALYWHCNDWHESSSSTRYCILSTLAYKPGALEYGPEPDSCAGIVYDELEGATDDELRDVEAWVWETRETELQECK